MIPGTPWWPKGTHKKKNMFWVPFFNDFSLLLGSLWTPICSPFRHWFSLFFLVVSKMRKKYIVSISALFWEVFWWHFVSFLGTGGHSDICTPFDEKRWFLKVPGLLFSHILSMFKRVSFYSSLLCFLTILSSPWHPFGYPGALFLALFFNTIFERRNGRQNGAKVVGSKRGASL